MDKFYIKENKGWTGPFVESEFEVKIAGLDEVTFWKQEFCPNHIQHPALCSHFKTMTRGEKETLKEPEVQTVVSKQEQMKIPEESSGLRKTTTQAKPEAVLKDELIETPSKPAGENHAGENGKNFISKPEPEIKADNSVSTTEPEKKEEKSMPEKENKPEKKEKDNQIAEKSVQAVESMNETTEKISSKPVSESTGEKPVQVKPSGPEPASALPETPAITRTGKEEKQGYLLKLAVIIIGFLLVMLAGFYVNSRLSVVKYQDAIIRNYIEEIDDRTNEILKEQQTLQKKMDSLKLLLGKELKAIKGIETGVSSGGDKPEN